MSTEDGLKLISLLAYSGVQGIVLAGGDPSLRRDLPRLCQAARAEGLDVELQTNAQVQAPHVIEALDHVTSVALSIDSAYADIHDRIRSQEGNFDAVVSMMRRLDSLGMPFRVRTVVTAETIDHFAALADLFTSMTSMTEWGIAEVASVGDANSDWGTVGVEREDFLIAAEQARAGLPTIARIVPSDAKHGAYAMIRSDGELYGTAGELDREGFYPTVGNLFEAHLTDLAAALPFSKSRHEDRYGSAPN